MARMNECNRCGKVYRPNEPTLDPIKANCVPSYLENEDLCDECIDVLRLILKHYMENKREITLLDPDNTFCKDCGRRNSYTGDPLTTNYCQVHRQIKSDNERMCNFFISDKRVK